MDDPNELIDNWCASALEYPFTRCDGTMTKQEYFKEYEYYKLHFNDVVKGTYKPLWKQAQERG